MPDTAAEIMVVDDDPAMREFLVAFLAERGYTALAIETAEQAVERFRASRPAAVILDVVLPGPMDGLEALTAFRRIDRDVPVIVVSGQGRTATVVQAMKLGATDFVSKPFLEGDLDPPLAAALRHRHVLREVALLREQLAGDPRHALLFGGSPGMAEVRELIERVADTDVTVLIRGESGTGKELVARALYAASHRRDKPFVKVNCAALPAELLESELFGFERGAFTGAIQHKPGKFEFANHGTMFLDEVSEMSPALQAKLLQVLQDGEFARLGGKADVRVDVRLVAATNRDLEHAVENGDFREDLFFRLNVVSIKLPPLRERLEEVAPLASFFLKKYAVRYNKPLIELSPETYALFAAHDWPGNVRELENLIKRAVVLGTEAPIQKDLQQAAASRARAAQVLPPRTSPEPHVAPPAPAPPPAAAPVAAVPVGGPVFAANAAVAAPPALTAAADGPALAELAIVDGRCSLKDISRHAAREAERVLILRMLQRTRWNRKEAAEILGISYKALLYKIKENGLDKAS
jgi:two-component system response regulator AtoC